MLYFISDYYLDVFFHIHFVIYLVYHGVTCKYERKDFSDNGR